MLTLNCFGVSLTMVEGKIFSGEGKASEFLSIQPYREFVSGKLGKEIFPGTLNLRGDAEEFRQLKDAAEHHRMESTQHNGRELGGIDLYNARIGSREVMIVEPDLTRYEDDVVEIIASERLRDALDVEDEEKLDLEPR